MTNPKLPQAIADLLVISNVDHIRTKLKSESACVLLAFECHKALRALEEVECSCSIDYAGYNDGMTIYAYGLEKVIYKGLGDTDEEAIFNAVLDWYGE